ncbi:hypothetical protein ACFL54_01980 [Planctomycetota bacterium]
MIFALNNNKRGAVLFIVTLITLILAVMAASYGSFISTDYLAVRNELDMMQAQYLAQAGVNLKVSEIVFNSSTYSVEEDIDNTDMYYGYYGDYGDYEMDAVHLYPGMDIPVNDIPVQLAEGTFAINVTENDDETITVSSTGTFKNTTQVVDIVLKRTDAASRYAVALFGDERIFARGSFFTDSYTTADGKKYADAYPDGSNNIGNKGDMGTNGDMTVTGGGLCNGDLIVTSPPYTEATAAALQADVYASGKLSPPNVVKLEPKLILTPVTYDPPPIGYTATNKTKTYDWPGSADPENPHAYRVTSLEFNPFKGITIEGHVVIYVDGEIDLKGYIKLLGENSSVTIIQGPGPEGGPAPGIVINAQAMLNPSEKPENFSIETASTGRVRMNGCGEVHGVIYAPDAFVDFMGTCEIFGSIVGNDIDIMGNATFHYDESLGEMRGLGGGDFEVIMYQVK